MDDVTYTKSELDFVCDHTSDEWTLTLAKYVEMHWFGQAWRHLDHYLKGTGQPLLVPLRQVIDEDQGVQRKLENTLRPYLNTCAEGVVSVPQSVYENKDWKLAIGGINLEWWRVESTPRFALSFTNWYQWHPNERRVTQCLHQAAERLKAKGARDYVMYGAAYVELDPWTVGSLPFTDKIPLIPSARHDNPLGPDVNNY